MSFINFQAMMANRFGKPDNFEQNFLNYVKGATNLPINTSKSIAFGTLVDMRAITGQQSVSFFDSTNTAFNPLVTNMQNSYTMPQDEHKFIFGIRMFDGVAALPHQTDWAVGLNNFETKNSNLRCDNNGTVEFSQIFGTEFVPTVFTKESGFVVLQQPFLWIGQNNLTIRQTFKTIPAILNQNVCCELLYYGLTS